MFTCWVSGSSQLRALLSSSGRSASPAPRAGAGTPPPDTANTRGHNVDMGNVIADTRAGTKPLRSFTIMEKTPICHTIVWNFPLFYGFTKEQDHAALGVW